MERLSLCSTTGSSPQQCLPTSGAAPETQTANQKYSAGVPPEILELILHNLSAHTFRDDLKRCRLVNRRFCHVATPILFHSIHFSTNLLSLRRLEQVAGRPNVARYVRRLVLHRGSWHQWRSWGIPTNPSRDAKALIDQGLIYTEGPKVVSQPDEAPNYRRNLLTEVQAELDLPKQWATDVQELLHPTHFPRLEEVYFPFISYDDPSEYHTRRIGRKHAPSSDRKFFLSTIVGMVGPIASLKSLHLQGVIFDEMACTRINSVLIHWPDSFKKLESLRLSIYSFHVRLPEDASEIARIMTMFLQASSRVLKTALLQFVSTNDQLYGNLTQAFTNLHYPRLRQLTLSQFTIEEEPFLAFLSRNSSTLKILSLQNWTMPVGLVQKTPIPFSGGSIVHAIWKIAQHTSLAEVHLDGVFYTTAEIDRDAGIRSNYPPHYRRASSCRSYTGLFLHKTGRNTDRHDGSDLLSQIEAYLTHRGPFPFPDSVLRLLEIDCDISGSEVAKIRESDARELGWLHYYPHNSDVWTLDAHPDVVSCSDDSWRFDLRGKFSRSEVVTDGFGELGYAPTP